MTIPSEGNPKMKLNMTLRTLISLIVMTALPVAGWAAGDNAAARKEKEQSLIKILESNAPPQDKAIPCKQLAIYGSKDAVRTPTCHRGRGSRWKRLTIRRRMRHCGTRWARSRGGC
jgi:hypothetical protein